jgi:poly-gamma-glutamate capsule biosynthesis protein CapA/YwtB (metallophosphatase superfamily)
MYSGSFHAVQHPPTQHARRIFGIGLAAVSLTVLSVGGAISSAAAEVQAQRLGRLGAARSTSAVRSAAQSAAQSAAASDETPDPVSGTPENPQAAGDAAANPDQFPPKTTTSSATWSVMVGGDSLLVRPGISVNPFERQSPLLRSADLSIINVETAISDSPFKVPKKYNFRSPGKFAEYIAEAGIDVGSLANNHSMDFDDQGLVDSIDSLREAGVDSVGAGVNRAAALKPSMHTINGLQVAVIGASQVTPDASWIATDSSIGVATVGKDLNDDNTAVLKMAIRKARSTADVVIVILHWGVEKDTCPTDLQQRTAAVLHNAGATLVVGAHPHVLQPIVRTGNDLTAYSMGNFIWDPRGGVQGDTGILEVNFTGATISAVAFHPHRLDGNGWAAPATGAGDRSRILGQVQRKCPGADGTGSLTP